MTPQNFGKYDGMQVVTGDSRCVNTEFRHLPPAIGGDHRGRSSELEQFVLWNLGWYWSEISS